MKFQEIPIQEKQKILQKAVVQLKKEFIGIDGIIDEVADVILPWWLFPKNQMRPLIINLWGMTGSGKTALIRRLSELIEYNNFLLRFDMGEFGNNSSFLKYSFTGQLQQFNETAPIIVLDEFQFAKTKDELGKEVNNTSLRIIWDLLDSGEIYYEPSVNIYYALRAKKICTYLDVFHKKGVQLKNGIILNDTTDELYELLTKYQFGYQDGTVDRTNSQFPYEKNEIIISDIFCTGILEISNLKYTNYNEVVDIIKEMNSLEMLSKFIQKINEEAGAPKIMNLSKSLIFVVGNLDEAYSMSNNINPDIDADEFRRYTLKINISDIKTALQSRFRNEQIARLGNNHLIYHAFSHKQFEKLITLHLNIIKNTIKKRFDFEVVFDKSVNEMLYAEGVFPTQGVRPVISTIRNLIESNIAKTMLFIYNNKIKSKTINWHFENDHFIISIDSSKDTLKLPVLQKINSLRKSVRNDLQAMVAVHEAGHTLVSMFLVNVVPEYVITRTVDSESNGFAYIILPEEIITKKLLLDKLKIGLGGYAAESFIFGKENNTTGVQADFVTATTIVHQLIREFGMTDEPYKINIHNYGGNPYQFTFTEDHEKTAKSIMKSCLTEVENCLSTHKKFLIEIAQYLSNNSRIDKVKLESMYKDYCKTQKIKSTPFLTKDTYYDFRNRLTSMK